jgi:hypothetical protein
VYYDEVAVTSFTPLELTIMKTEIRKFVAALSTLGLLAFCVPVGALEVQNDNTSADGQDTETFTDHDSIASLYEDTAKKMLIKAEEHKNLLQHYRDKSYFYGSRGYESQSQTVALVRKYELAAEKANTRSAFHRGMAAELAKPHYLAAAQP